jgi:hypothetical protein
MLLIFNRFYSNIILNLIDSLSEKFETGLKEIILVCDIIEDDVPIAPPSDSMSIQPKQFSPVNSASDNSAQRQFNLRHFYHF